MNRWFSARVRAYQVRIHIESKLGRELYGVELLSAIIEDEDIILDEVVSNDPLLGGENDKYCQATYDPEYKTITVNREVPPEQYVLYVSHETGHHFLHIRRDICNKDDADPERIVLTVPYAEGRIATYNPYQLQEHEANIFAAELLIPSQRLAEKFDAGMGVDELADFFSVSKYSIFAQLLNAVLEPPIEFEQYIAQEKERPFHWKDLDSYQQEAACVELGPIRVDAGPGTGKTRTLTSRIEWLIENNTPPETIIALTFSNKATGELRQRLRTVLPDQMHQITVSTFHGFGVELLRRYGSYAAIKQDFTILDPIDAETLLSEHLDQLHLRHFADPINPDKYLAEGAFGGSILGFISRIKQELITSNMYDEHIKKMAENLEAEDAEKYREIGYVYRQYERLMREANVVDYDDLVMLPVIILKDRQELIDELHTQYKHILVDEFQDINRANGELVRLLAGDGQGLWVVGDLRQSIYRWRGASPVYLRDFQEHYPQAETKPIEINYRSTEQLVNYLNMCASSLQLTDNPVVWQSDRGDGEPSSVMLVTATSKYDEQLGVIGSIRELRSEHDYQYSDFAVLCRTNRIASEFAEALQRADIPVLHFGNYYERPEVKVLLAVVDLVANAHGVSWIRVAQNLEEPLSRQQAIDLWQQMRADNHSFPDALNIIAKASELSAAQSAEVQQLADILSDYQYQSLANPWLIMAEFLFTHGRYLRRLRRNLEQNMPNLLAIGHLMNLARSYSQRKLLTNNQSRADAFLNHIRSLVKREDGEVPVPSVTDGIDAVTVLTIHKAKGLEFPVVFVPHIAAGTFPPRGGPEIMPMPEGLLSDVEVNARDLEEKSNLFVAISRARNHLILSYPNKQDNGNKRNPSNYWNHFQHSSVVRSSWTNFDSISSSPGNLEEHVAGDRAEVSASGMRRLQYCPRQFFYHDVLQLKVTFKRDIYLDFHNAVSQTIEWIQRNIEARQIIDQDAAISEFMTQFDRHMPENHTHRNWYELEGKQQIAFILEDIRLRHQNGEVAYNVAISARLEGIKFAITIDEIAKTPDGYEAIHYRIGRMSNGNLRMHLYRQALKDSDYKPLKFVTHSLFDKQRDASTERDERKKASDLKKNIDFLRRNEYPPTPAGNWVCASCPFFFICPT